MKFKKDGKVFETIGEAQKYYCEQVPTTECHKCNLYIKKMPLGYCQQLCEESPRNAAALMGYEVLEDEQEPLDIGSMTLKQAKDYCFMHYKSGCHTDETDCELAKYGVCSEYVHLWDIERPRLTQQELEICNALGAKYVTKDKTCNDGVVVFWVARPHMDDYVDYGYNKDGNDADFLIASVSARIFKSVKPGDCICVEDCTK